MLLLHQVGSVKIGEVVRYTVTYVPSQDRILPSPERLFFRVKNTSAIALRAALLHGPYTICVASYPANFQPNEKFQNPQRYGYPECEPMLKAGGSWECELVVPEEIRQSAGTGGGGVFGKGPDHDGESASWIIEITSQVIFSTSAAVGYELVVARDHKSLSLNSSFPTVGDKTHVPQPGRISDHQQSIGAKDGHHNAQPKGVFSRAVHVKVEDTATLWNTPRLPGWDDAGASRINEKRPGADAPVESMNTTGDPETEESAEKAAPEKAQKPKKLQKVHLVVLTHGLHSNLGADMLFMKESIDAAVKQAKMDAKVRKRQQRSRSRKEARKSSVSGEDQQEDGEEEEEEEEDESDDDDDEEVIVRGYSGNATKTERGIKYLGKRLARYVLAMTYPDQPFIPLGKGVGEGVHQRIEHDPQTKSSHKHSTIHTEGHRDTDLARRPYRITSISFIAHSLGGLVQTYAVAYIQKHSPEFFDLIQPINFIALASPFLGLSNENPLYVKFALDFGLVGRTGKDLGLTWRAPTIARSGWGAIVSNLGESAHRKVYGDSQPESKPLLRILPTGPAHTALRKFRNRTVYSNVVNDGIVPLRTSCLLFLDWQGLGRVEKAWRDAGLVETMVGFGWAELTGSKMTMQQRQKNSRLRAEKEAEQAVSGTATPKAKDMTEVPQPAHDAIDQDDRASIRSVPTPFQEDGPPVSSNPGEPVNAGPLAGFFNLFRKEEHAREKEPTVSSKQQKIFRRSQTTQADENTIAGSDSTDVSKGSKVTSGQELEDDPDNMTAPPRTTFFESAGDLINPKVPDMAYLVDPSKRPRTIFHDRVYHPSDIPPPPMKEQHTSSFLSRRKSSGKLRSSSSSSSTPGSTSPAHGQTNREDPSTDRTASPDSNTIPKPSTVVDNSNMRIEEKIARGYHRDLSWRKVLVKLEPDAHNNILVRRKFVNAFGWPVIKHLTDVHFSDLATARTRTDDDYLGEQAKDVNQPPDEDGGETKEASDTEGNRLSPQISVNTEEAGEARDEVPALPHVPESDLSSPHHNRPSQFRLDASQRVDSMAWSDKDWIDSENESEPDAGDSETRRRGKEGGEKGVEEDKSGSEDGRSSPIWNWAEKIVGKGSVKKTRNPSQDETDRSGPPRDNDASDEGPK